MLHLNITDHRKQAKDKSLHKYTHRHTFINSFIIKKHKTKNSSYIFRDTTQAQTCASVKIHDAWPQQSSFKQQN